MNVLTARILPLVLMGICLFWLPPQTKTVGISSAKVVSLYESVFDTDVSTLTRILTETRTQIVFRGFFKWGIENLTDPRGPQRIREIKAAVPGIHIMGGITCAHFVDGDHWPNGTIVSTDQKQQMLWILPNGTIPRYFGDAGNAYVLDISKPLAIQFILQNSYKLIDIGFDSLFFDEVSLIPWSSGDLGQERISEEPYLAAWKIISSSVKVYARTMYGKELPVTLNNGDVNAIEENPWPASHYWSYQDFISIGIAAQTVESQSIQDDWAGYKAALEQAYGYVPQTMVFVDWGTPPTPMSLFGELPAGQQVKMLIMLHKAVVREGFLFVYPIHGGEIAHDPYAAYDARKQGTYDAIRQLTNELAGAYTQTVMHTATTEQMIAGMRVSELSSYPSGLLVVLVSGLMISLAVILKRKKFKQSASSSI
jgi:hypothetical protein